MIFPDKLKKGDKIKIIAPAKAIEPKQIKEAIKIFENWGLEVILGKHIFDEYYQFAGTDENRLQDLQEAFDDQEIKAIICARGGYGSARLLPDLHFENLLKYPKCTSQKFNHSPHK